MALNTLLKNVRCGIGPKMFKTSFEDIKNMFISELSITHFSLDLEIIVASDARDYSIGVVISYISFVLHAFRHECCSVPIIPNRACVSFLIISPTTKVIIPIGSKGLLGVKDVN